MLRSLRDRWLLTGVLFGVLSVAVPGVRGQLAGQLSADTVVYVHGDLQRFIVQGSELFRTADPEHGEAVVRDVCELWDKLQDMGEAYEFQPKLFDCLNQTQAYLVWLKLPEKIVTTTTTKVPQFPTKPEDWENFDPAAAGMTDQEQTEEHTHCLALVLETPSTEVAQDFFTQLRGLLIRQKEKNPAKNVYELEAVAVNG